MRHDDQKPALVTVLNVLGWLATLGAVGMALVRSGYYRPRVFRTPPGRKSFQRYLCTGLDATIFWGNHAELRFPSLRRTMEYDAKYCETFGAMVACYACSACLGGLRLPLPESRQRAQTVNPRCRRSASNSHGLGTPAR
jgi:hypothetical protein